YVNSHSSLLFFFHSYADHRYFHSFPTRRSSDLVRLRLRRSHDDFGWLQQVNPGRRSPSPRMSPAAAGRFRAASGTLGAAFGPLRSEEHTSELQSRFDLVCRLLLEKKKSHQ